MIPWPSQLLRLLFVLYLATLAIQRAGAEVPKCGKPQSGVLILQDFIQHPLGKPAEPALPSGVDQTTLPFTISLRITVNREGTVVHVCAMDHDHSPSPTVRLLNEAASSAVVKWKYPSDFGLVGDLHLSHRYGQGVVSFRFVPLSTPTTR
jgi:hypothetical protein